MRANVRPADGPVVGDLSGTLLLLLGGGTLAVFAAVAALGLRGAPVGRRLGVAVVGSALTASLVLAVARPPALVYADGDSEPSPVLVREVTAP